MWFLFLSMLQFLCETGYVSGVFLILSQAQVLMWGRVCPLCWAKLELFCGSGCVHDLGQVPVLM